ncbi:MAG TPA: hypothetical protein VKU40_11205 [Thermoanaerobaculia bacterium]|nr:hypothetical protein [Thermoanaerobaculia bacterium]
MSVAASARAAARRPRARVAEPGTLWTRYTPRRWPPPDHPWLDVAAGRLGWPAPEGSAAPRASHPLPTVGGAPLDDLLWLPPVAAAQQAERDAVAAAHLDHGTPVVVQLALQLAPGGAPPIDGVTPLYDLTPLLVAAGRGDGFDPLPAAAAVVWPLVAGVSDDPELQRDLLGRLAAAGAAAVQAVVPRLTPADRRRLAEGAPDEVFDRIFHAPVPDERAFARAAVDAGLAPFVPRPLPRPSADGTSVAGRVASRRVAAALHLVAELWLRLERPPEQGQAIVRAARWIDDSGYDPEALARDGNLGVVEPLDPLSRRLIEEAAASGDSPALLADLAAEYAGEAVRDLLRATAP